MIRVLIVLAMLIGPAATAAAGEAMAATPAMADMAEPPAEISPGCVAADAALLAKLDPIRSRQGIGATLPLGDVLAALSRARALCQAGEPDRGMLVYIRVHDAVANAMAVPPLSANR